MRTLILFLLITFCLPVSAQAHSLFIQSGRHYVSSGKGTPMFFCYGHHIPVDDAVRRKKLSYVRVIEPDGVRKDVPLRDEKSLHSYVITYEKPGTHVLVAETTPGYFTIWYDKKGRKRHSIKPMSKIASKASRVETSLRSSQWAKAYVTCEKPSPKFPAKVGLPLELVPEQDVTTLKPGDKLRVSVYLDGKPYTGEGFYDATYNGFSPHAEDMFVPRAKTEDGTFTIPIKVQGRWYVRFYTKVPAAKNANYLQEKRTATMVFMVRGERIRPKAKGH